MKQTTIQTATRGRRAPRAGAVDGIELPTDTEDVRVALTEAWGQPYIDDVTPGCGAEVTTGDTGRSMIHR